MSEVNVRRALQGQPNPSTRRLAHEDDINKEVEAEVDQRHDNHKEGGGCKRSREVGTESKKVEIAPKEIHTHRPGRCIRSV